MGRCLSICREAGAAASPDEGGADSGGADSAAEGASAATRRSSTPPALPRVTPASRTRRPQAPAPGPQAPAPGPQAPAPGPQAPAPQVGAQQTSAPRTPPQQAAKPPTPPRQAATRAPTPRRTRTPAPPASGPSQPQASESPAEPRAARGASTTSRDTTSRDPERPPTHRRRRGRVVVAATAAVLIMVIGTGAFFLAAPFRDGERSATADIAAPPPSTSATEPSTPATEPSTPATDSSPTPSPTGAAKVPFGDGRFYVRPEASAATWVRQSGTDPRRTRIQQSIANQPTAEWFSDDVRPGQLSTYVRSARTAGQVPVLISFRLPKRVCGDGGGVTSAAAYRTWIDELARGVAGGPAVVLLEPFSIATYGCVPKADGDERLTLLREAVATLAAAAPQATVYLDGGGVNGDPAAIAGLLERAGADQARGFAVNVAELGPTSAATRHADAVSAKLVSTGVKSSRYVIDTSRSGGDTMPPEEPVCNPSWARAGEAPGLRDGPGAVDAYVWSIVPGTSDGKCGGSTVDNHVFDPVIAERMLSG
ncbi:MAG: glycoside hydrolase family 6 protein [Dermatophilaceae bacterium]